MYNIDKDVESEKPDISVDLTMGGLRIVFLNWYVTRMLVSTLVTLVCV